MLKQAAFVLLSFMVITLCSCKVNQLKDGLRTGLWISKDDYGDVVYKSRGRFKNGREKGAWKYYHGDTLFKKEKYTGNKAWVRFYHPNKKIMAKGHTQMDFNPKGLHWYYSGDWKYFDLSGKLLKIVTYKLGTPVSEKNLEENGN